MGLLQLNLKQKSTLNTIYKTIEINWKGESAILVMAIICFLTRFKVQNYEEFETEIKRSLDVDMDIVAKGIIYTKLGEVVNTVLSKETELKKIISIIKDTFMSNPDDDIAYLIDCIYLKEAQDIKAKNKGVVFTPPSISYFIDKYISAINWDKDELSVLDICAGTGLLTSQIRSKKHSLTFQELDPNNLTTVFLKCLISRKKAVLRGGDYFGYQSRTTERFHIGICNPPYYDKFLQTPHELSFITNLCDQVDGLVFSIIPLSCLTAIKDRVYLKKIKEKYEILSIFRLSNDLFHAASIETVLLVIDTRSSTTVYENNKNEHKVYIDPVYENISHVNFKFNKASDDDPNGWKNWVNNFNFTEHFNKRIEESLLKTPHIYCEMLNKEYDINNKFGLTQYLNFEDLFEVIRGGTGERDQTNVSDKKLINFIGASKYSRGFKYKTHKYHNSNVYEAGSITISKLFGATFIQKERFIASKDVIILVPNEVFLALDRQGRYTLEMFADQMNNLLLESSYFNKVSINKLKTLPILIREEHRYLFPLAKEDIGEALNRIVNFIRVDPKGTIEEVALTLHLYSDDNKFKQVKNELLDGILAQGNIYTVSEDQDDPDIKYSLDFLYELGCIEPLATGKEVVRVINYYLDNLQKMIPLGNKS